MSSARRRLLGTAAALVTLATLACACGSSQQPFSSSAAIATGTGSPSTNASLAGATATITAFLDALHAGDCSSAFALAADPLRSATKTAQGLCASQSKPMTYTVGPPTSLSDTSAFATVTLNSGAQATLETVTILYQGSRWLVSGIVANGIATGQSASPGTAGAGIAATIAQQYTTQNGGAVATVSCPPPPDTGYPAGQQFQCTFSDSAGRTGTMTVTIGASSGAFTWAIP